MCGGSVCVCSHREFFDRILAVQGALLRIRVESCLYYSPHQKTAVICFPGIVVECVVRVSVCR